MRITPIQPALAASTIPAPLTTAPSAPDRSAGVVTLRKGEALPSEIPGWNDPNVRYLRVYNQELFALPGVVGIGYGTGSTTDVRINVDSLRSAQMADAILRDSALGARPVFLNPFGKPWDLGAGYTGTAMDLARAISALPGVVRHQYSGGGAFMFYPESTETRVKLKQLVSPTFGQARTMWFGDCFGPGCKPDPAPPTGEEPSLRR